MSTTAILACIKLFLEPGELGTSARVASLLYLTAEWVRIELITADC